MILCIEGTYQILETGELLWVESYRACSYFLHKVLVFYENDRVIKFTKPTNTSNYSDDWSIQFTESFQGLISIYDLKYIKGG